VERPRSFWLGFLAHMILVPSWTVSPAVLLIGLLQACANLGIGGIMAGFGLFGGLVASKSSASRAALCAVVVGLATRAKGRAAKVRSLLAAGLVSLLTWMVSTGGSYAQRPRLIEFLCDRAKDFYSRAEIRGALGDLRPERTFYAFHPHGCLSAGWTINGTFNPVFTRAAGRVNWLIDPGLRHKNPLFRMLCDAYRREDRAIEATSEMQELMSQGQSVALIPGGFQDAVAFQFRKECCVVRRRKGFVKYCLQYGYRLHPVYTFGESETYHTFTGLRALRMAISENNVPMVMFFGWPLCPILPRPKSQILTYVGHGIDLPHIPKPSPEQVDHWHGVYVDALQRLFDESKVEAGYPDATLEIL